MKKFTSVLVALILSACSMGARSQAKGDGHVSIAAADIPVLGVAPELTNTVWLNTEGPLRLADLRGKVVLIDMWTFG